MSQLGVGQQLRQVRQDRRISLADVTTATKIQPWVLEALEADRLHLSMSPVYAKSFLVLYAKFLRLDPQPLIAQLFPPPPAPSAAEAGRSLAQEAEGFSLSLDAMWDAVGAILRRLAPVAVVAAGVALLIAVKPLRRLPSLRVTQASFSTAPAKPAATQQMALAVRPTQPLELGVVARHASWISVKADGDLIAQQQLSPGSKETWTAKRRLEVVIGNPAQVDVFLNGHAISPLAMAHDGRLLITHKGIAALGDSSQ